MLHNYFKISQNGRSQISFNSLNNVFLNYVESARIGKYFYIRTQSGKLAYLETQIEDYNFDIANGQCFCKYSAILDRGVLSETETVTEIGFSARQNIMRPVNSAPFSFILEEDRAVISGILYLEAITETVNFTKGDNELIKIFLGARDFPYYDFEMAIGDNYLLNAPIERESGGIIESKTVYPFFSDSGVLFSTTFSSPVTEVILLFESKPVLRYKNESSSTIQLNAKTSQNKGYVLLEQDYITDISDVLINSERVYNYSLVPIAEALSKLTKSDSIFNKDSRIFSHEDINNFAFLSNNENLTLYKNHSGKLKPYKWLNATDARVCSDGSIVSFDKNFTHIFLESGQLRIRTANIIGEKNEAVFMTDKYLITTYSNNEVRLNYIDNYNNLTVQTLSYQGQEVNFINLGNQIAVVSTNSVRVFSPYTENTALASFLNQNRNLLLKNKSSYKNNRITFSDFPSYIDLMEANIKTINKNGKIFCDFFVYEENGKSCVTSLDDTQKILIKTDSIIKHLFTQGKYVFILTEDGNLSTYLISHKKTKLCHLDINIGSVISYYSRQLTHSSGQIGFSLQRAT